jgi:hypothetical protein
MHLPGYQTRTNFSAVSIAKYYVLYNKKDARSRCRSARGDLRAGGMKSHSLFHWTGGIAARFRKDSGSETKFTLLPSQEERISSV